MGGQLNTAERRQRIATMRADGCSSRVIANALGVSQALVMKTLARLLIEAPAWVYGTDGKRYRGRRVAS